MDRQNARKNINKEDVVLDFQGGYYNQVEIAEIHGCSKQNIGRILDTKIPSRIERKQKLRLEKTRLAIMAAKKWTGIR